MTNPNVSLSLTLQRETQQQVGIPSEPPSVDARYHAITSRINAIADLNQSTREEAESPFIGISNKSAEKIIRIAVQTEHFCNQDKDSVTLRFLTQASYAHLIFFFLCPKYYESHRLFPVEELGHVAQLLLKTKKTTASDLELIDLFFAANFPEENRKLRRDLRRACLSQKLYPLLKLLIDRREPTPPFFMPCPVYEAILNEEKERVKALISEGASLSLFLQGGSTVLHRTLLLAKYDYATLLIEGGALLNLRDLFTRNTPMMTWMVFVCDANQAAVLTEMVENGADINAFNAEQETCLLISLQKQNFALLQICLELGADPNLPDRNGKTPLHFASELCEIDYLRKLIDFGADPALPDKKGKTAINYAQRGRKKENVDFLRSYTKKEADAAVKVVVHHRVTSQSVRHI